MSDGPAWKDDFPIAWADDDLVTRRAFTRSLLWVSCASFASSAALAASAALRGGEPLLAARIAVAGELPVGGAKVFHYPDADTPCVLIRTGAERFVAFAQRCTHLGCPVIYEAQARRLACPCHEGYFDAASGRVLSGPPPRPLPAVAIELRAGDVWAVGMRA